MTPIMTLTDAVGDCVTRHPATARVFEQYKIDYCCGGGQSLEEACWSVQADAQILLAELTDAVARERPDTESDFSSHSLTEMCDTIETTHHQYLKQELPRLTQLVEKVFSVHGAQHSWLARLSQSFRRLREELEPHMFKEERVLFPAIRKIERDRVAPSFPFGSVDNPIRMMEHEHESAGRELKEIREASSNFTLPNGGCNTFRVMLDGLRQLEADLHLHIHKENNILFPRTSQMAAELASRPAERGGLS